MGDTASNLGGPWMHTDPAGNVLDVRLGGYHYTPATGSAWTTPGPMAPGDYAALHGAAWTSGPAFASAIAGTSWGTFYAGLDAADKLAIRRLVADCPPRVKVAPPIPA